MTALAASDRAALLGIARGAILTRLGLTSPPSLPSAGPLVEPRGAFVTVHVGGALRGCIGSFQPAPLAEAVARLAVSAASEDPRFVPVEAADASELEVAVSVLSPTRPLGLDARRSVKVGEHGLLVRRGFHRGTLLPRVAVEQGWTAEEFLKHTCLKAGLHARAWEEEETEVLVFEAEEFGEGGAP